MKCLLNVFVLFLINIYVVSGSIVELNETTLLSLPPLYGLDEWSQCQRDGDVYCIVDADLVATQQNDLLDLLKSYSAQTLKHYNRTQIHRGVCISRCVYNSSSHDSSGYDSSGHDSSGYNSSGLRSSAAEKCLNDSMAKYNLQTHITSVGHCSPLVPRVSGSRVLLTLCVALVAVVFAATLLHVMCQRCAAFEGNKYLLAFSLKQNWAILTYDRTKPRTDDRMKDLACLEGVRFIGMQCVIFSHVLFIYLYSFTDNPEFIENMYDNFFWQTVLNSPLWLQSFFAMSGLLTSYSVLISSENSPVTVVKCAVSVVTRWMRLTPLAASALAFTIYWFPLLGAGPHWRWLVGREAEDCVDRCAAHLVYLHNYLPLGRLCMGHTWYLAVDMQLHVLGMICLYIMVNYKRTVVPLLSVLLLVSPVASALTVYLYDLTPIITAQSPEALRTMFSGSLVMSLLYLPTYQNFSGYFTGVAVAFLWYHCQRNGIKINAMKVGLHTMFVGSLVMSLLYLPTYQNCSGYFTGVAVTFLWHHCQRNGIKINAMKWFNIIFHLSLHVGGAVVMTGVIFLGDASAPREFRAMYAAADRALVSAAFGVFMLGAVAGCQSAFTRVLKWRGFHPLGRLSYCAFLVHFIVLRLTLASDTRLQHATALSLISLLITASTLTYVISIPLVLLIELPALQLWKAMTERDRAPMATPPPPRESPPAPLATPQGNKLFDLVAHIRRRQDV